MLQCITSTQVRNSSVRRYDPRHRDLHKLLHIWPTVQPMASPCLTACHRVQASHSTSRHRTMTPHLFAPHSVPAHAPARRCSGRRVAAQGATVEAVTGLDPSLTPLIEAALDDCLTETSLDLPGTHYVVGRVGERVQAGWRGPALLYEVQYPCSPVGLRCPPLDTPPTSSSPPPPIPRHPSRARCVTHTTWATGC